MDGALQESLQQGLVKATQFLTKPKVTGECFLSIKAIGGSWVNFQMEVQLNHQEWMFEQKATKLSGVDHAFTDAYKKGFDVSTFRMSRSPSGLMIGLPLFYQRPIKQREKRSIVLDNGITVEKVLHGGLVKDGRCGYHSRELLLWMELVLSYFAKGVLLSQGK